MSSIHGAPPRSAFVQHLLKVRTLLRASISVLAVRILPGFFVLVIFLHGLFRIAEFCLYLARDLIRHALRLLRHAADGFACHFLHFARHFFGAAFNLIFVDTHGPAPRVYVIRLCARGKGYGVGEQPDWLWEWGLATFCNFTVTRG